MGTYQEENNQILINYVNRILTSNFRRPIVELIVTSSCDLACSYCYIHKHGDELYPKSIRSNDDIIKNTGLIIDWLIENKYHCDLDLFSGELFAGDVGFNVIEVIYDKLKDNPGLVEMITVPTNMSFIKSEAKTKVIENFIEKFKDIKINFRLSASVDGKYLQDNRAYKDGTYLDDEYFDKLFTFFKNHPKNALGFHPMVSSINIDKWIDNYKWFMDMINKYDILRLKEPMMLEVRDDNWDDNSIEGYLKFLNYVLEYNLKKFNNNVQDLYKSMYTESSNPRRFVSLYTNTKIYNKHPQSPISCSLPSSLIIRLGDLAIVPCHRLMYPNNISGKFTVKGDKITSIRALNLSTYLTVKSIPGNQLPTCSQCKYKNFCIKGCLGAQYEVSGDMFYTIKSVCNLYKAKTQFLIYKYKVMGLYEHLYGYFSAEDMRTLDDIFMDADITKFERVCGLHETKSVN